jgi:hypothetical protein
MLNLGKNSLKNCYCEIFRAFRLKAHPQMYIKQALVECNQENKTIRYQVHKFLIKKRL